MSSSLPEEIAAFISVQRTIYLPVTTLSVMYFIYGFYALLFGTYVYMMRSGKNRDSNGVFYLSLTTVLFVISTIFVVNHSIALVRASVIHFSALKTGEYKEFVNFLQHSTEKTVGYAIDYLASAFLNIVAEIMLIHRCYVIWSSNKRVAVPLLVTFFLVNAVGLAGAIMIPISVRDTTIKSNAVIYLAASNVNFAYGIISAVNNLVLTLLTAGRIWWTHRKLAAQGVYANDGFVRSIARIILESGVLYPICQIAGLIEANTLTISVAPFDISVLVALSAGIAPTLVMVRAKLSRSHNVVVEEGVSDIRFTRSPKEDTTASAQIVNVFEGQECVQGANVFEEQKKEALAV